MGAGGGTWVTYEKYWDQDCLQIGGLAALRVVDASPECIASTFPFRGGAADHLGLAFGQTGVEPSVLPSSEMGMGGGVDTRMQHIPCHARGTLKLIPQDHTPRAWTPNLQHIHGWIRTRHAPSPQLWSPPYYTILQVILAEWLFFKVVRMSAMLSSEEREIFSVIQPTWRLKCYKAMIKRYAESAPEWMENKIPEGLSIFRPYQERQEKMADFQSEIAFIEKNLLGGDFWLPYGFL